MITAAQLAGIVDHTILKPETTTAEVEAHCREAVELGVFSVCVSPSFLPSPRTGCTVLQWRRSAGSPAANTNVR